MILLNLVNDLFFGKKIGTEPAVEAAEGETIATFVVVGRVDVSKVQGEIIGVGSGLSRT